MPLTLNRLGKERKVKPSNYILPFTPFHLDTALLTNAQNTRLERLSGAGMPSSPPFVRPLQILSPAADVFRDVVDLLVFESGPINAAKLQCSSYGFTSLMEADRRIGRLGWSLSINSSLARDDI